MKSANTETGSAKLGGDEAWLEIVRRHVGSLSDGVVQIVVHGARVVQIDRTEKVRIESSGVASVRADPCRPPDDWRQKDHTATDRTIGVKLKEQSK